MTRMPESGARARPSLTRPGWSAIEVSGIAMEQLPQYLRSVFAQEWGRFSDRAGLTVDLPWCADLVDLAGFRVLDLEAHFALGRQRTRKGLRDVEDRSRRNAELLEPRQPFGTGAFTKVRLDRADELRPRRLAQGIRREPGIGCELAGVDRLAESNKLRVRRHRQVNETVTHSEGAVGRNRRVMVALLNWDFACGEEPAGLVGEEREQRIVEGHVDIAAPARLASLQQCGENRVARNHPSRDVSNWDANFGRWAVWSRVHAHHPRSALGDLVIARQGRLALPEAADRCIHERRLHALQLHRIYPQPCHRARLVILHDDVARHRELFCDATPCGILQIQDHAPLVAVH